ncbi:O-antigen ligase family protein [Sinorhizobium sp. BG8]|uniref:O-antigen ligase family protein n=1 Tax=Sinorhizobium sp. BG8 TaxID=2613773 RepID=UPI00193E7DD5|nr:O-antigen ligase family protein [Sinorhizobium sp. BG8]QRM57460.1 O-antigen ligase family protein [Sinorhizobium sp. BG8]
MKASGHVMRGDGFRRNFYGRAEPSKYSIASTIEHFLLCAAVFTSPANILRLDFFYFTLSDFLFLLCFALAALRGGINIHPLGKVSTAVWTFGLSMLVIGLTVSSMIGPDPSRGIAFGAQYFFAYYFVLVLIGGRSLDELVSLAKVYVLSMCLMCVHGMYVVNVLNERNTVYVSGAGRFQGFVERENACAALMAFTAPLLLLLVAAGRLSRIYLFIGLPILAYGVMLTGSNSGLMALTFGVAVFALVGITVRRVVIGLTVGLAIVALSGDWMTDYLPDVFQKRVLGAIETGDLSQAGTFDDRMELIHEAVQYADRTMFVGVGADQYRKLSSFEKPVHNVYLLLWMEGGAISVLGFIVMTLASFGPAVVALRTPGGLPFAICIFTNIVAFMMLVNAFTHVYGRFWSVPVILSVALACAHNARYVEQSR